MTCKASLRMKEPNYVDIFASTLLCFIRLDSMVWAPRRLAAAIVEANGLPYI